MVAILGASILWPRPIGNHGQNFVEVVVSLFVAALSILSVDSVGPIRINRQIKSLRVGNEQNRFIADNIKDWIETDWNINVAISNQNLLPMTISSALVEASISAYYSPSQETTISYKFYNIDVIPTFSPESNSSYPLNVQSIILTTRSAVYPLDPPDLLSRLVKKSDLESNDNAKAIVDKTFPVSHPSTNVVSQQWAASRYHKVSVSSHPEGYLGAIVAPPCEYLGNNTMQALPGTMIVDIELKVIFKIVVLLDLLSPFEWDSQATMRFACPAIVVTASGLSLGE
ncbi:hypothetical protein BJ742DRAFT_733803 [Cladochytrium replicatum]|nr:hypothetical protein BJ742DRAFT_733803 [Cladochytrium replicatum]